MTERACFSNTPLGQPIKCRPRLSISFDLKNQPGCHEIANWKTENGKLIPSGNNTIRISNSLIQSVSVDIGPSSAAFHVEWDIGDDDTTSQKNNSSEFVCKETSSLLIDKYLNFENSLTYPILRNAHATIKLKSFPFFAHMFEYFIRSDTDTFNLADPIDESVFGDSFTGEFDNPLKPPKEYIIDNVRALSRICVNSASSKGSERTYSIDLKLFIDLPSDFTARKQAILIASEFSHVHINELNRKRAIDNNRMAPDFFELSKHRQVAWFGINIQDFKSLQIIESKKLGSPFLPINTVSIEQNIKALLSRDFSNQDLDDCKLIIEHEDSIARQEENVYRYLISQMPIERGKRIQYDALQKAAKPNASRNEIVEILRNQLDKKIVPVNFWNELREDVKAETHQYKVMKAFEWMATRNISTNPIRIIRLLRERAAPLFHCLTKRKNALSVVEYSEVARSSMNDTSWKLALQMGIGNCGEHSLVSFNTLKALIDSNPQKYTPLFKNIIRADLQNGDHAFVLGGFIVKKLYFSKKGGGSYYWKLDEQSFEPNSQEKGFVLDTYIEEIHNMTIDDFKNYLKKHAHSPEEIPEMMKMHWLEQYPSPIPEEIIK